MTTRTLLTRFVATLLVACLPGLGLPAPAPGATASLSGTVLAAEADAPIAGARVYAADPKSGEIHAAEPAGPDGRFAVGGLPAATYELGVEVDGGLYLVGTPVTLAAGQAQSVNLAVRRSEAATRSGSQAQSKPSLWSNPLTAALIVLGAAVVVGVLVENATDDDDEPPASAFAGG